MSTQDTDPLNGLDGVNWAQFTDAYGPADAVPTVLTQLKSADPDVYLPALDECWSRICHQSTRYSASVEAVPFLYSLIDHQATKNRHNLLFLLTGLAVGDSLWCVPNGVNITEWERRLANIEDSKNQQYALCELKTYETVEQGLASIVRCLEEKSPAMRWTAAHALALFPRRFDMVVPPLLNLLRQETCKVVRGATVLSLAILFGPLDEGDSRRVNFISEVQDHYDSSCGKGTADDVFIWFCALALITLGRVQEEYVEKAERLEKDATYRASIQASIDPDAEFSMELFEIATAVLEKTQEPSTTR
ncbi:hypothetical protein ACLX1H_009112 [Fusarium chlamydosporum]